MIWKVLAGVVALAFALAPAGAAPQEPAGALPPPVPAAVHIVGGEEQHAVEPRDTLQSVSAWYGIDAKVLAAENGLKPGAKLQPGQTIRVPTRHIVPPGSHHGIVINIPQRHLFHFVNGALLGHYPVAVGRGDWKTPTGGFHVAVKEENPTWEVPKSIQEEMRQAGKPVLTAVPPGPDNPLGRFWLGLNRTGVGIHGTNNAESIYRITTHGCVRMHPEDIEELYTRVAIKTPVAMIYQPVLVAISDAAVFVEAHPDVYRKGSDPLNLVQRAASEAGAQDRIDWDAVKQVLLKREGIARQLSR